MWFWPVGQTSTWKDLSYVVPSTLVGPYNVGVEVVELQAINISESGFCK